MFGTMAQAVEELQEPRLQPPKPYRTYAGTLTLEDPENPKSTLSINVERYFKTRLARPPTASSVVVKTEPRGPTQSTETLDKMEGVEHTGVTFSAVRDTRTYKINDPDAPGGKRDVEVESLAKGYEYGKTAVYFDEAEQNITAFETEPGFSILGFIKSSNVRGHDPISWLESIADGRSMSPSSTWGTRVSPLLGASARRMS